MRRLLLLLLLLLLWRGGLSERRTAPFGCEAVANPVTAVCQTFIGCRFWRRFAAQRGQAPSPQVLLWLERGAEIADLDMSKG